MRTPHSSCRKGKRVKIKLRNGKSFISKFIENKGNRVYFECGDWAVSELKSFTIYKNPTKP